MIDINQVSSVYSGIDGKCCCGCAGKHRYASAHRIWASANRGYPVTDDDVSDRSVKIIVGKLNKNPATVDNGDFHVVTVGNRVLIAYMKD